VLLAVPADGHESARERAGYVTALRAAILGVSDVPSMLETMENNNSR
jgi:hypothetical protein